MNRIIFGDALAELKKLPDNSVSCCVTSPPYYGLRDYGTDGQIGLEATPIEYVEKMVGIFREVRRVLRPDGTLWLNIGDSYAGSGKGRRADGTHQEGGKQGTNKGTIIGELHRTTVAGVKRKDLIGIPWMLAFALRADGWYLRSDIIWDKPNAMPESVRDRPTRSHEYIFLMTKSCKYYYDADAIKEPAVNGDRSSVRGSSAAYKPNAGRRKQDAVGKSRYTGFNSRYFSDTPKKKRNKRDVWRVTVKPYKGAHFATFPPDLIEPCVLAGCPSGGIVIDPFMGSGTTGIVAKKNGRGFIGIDNNIEYCRMADKRMEAVGIEPRDF